MRKILISDFDNTLYTDEKNMKLNIEKLKDFREAGNLFIVATGRSYVSFENKLKRYPIPFDYLILSHGTIILDRDKKLVLNFNIEKEIVNEILDGLKYFKDIINKIKLFDIYNEDVKIDSEIITKIRVLTNTVEDANIISKYINNNFNVKSYVVNAKIYIFAEIIPINTDKGEAISRILDIENIKEQNVYAIGDGSNDVEMISKYNGYGMTKSDDCVKEVAKKLYDNVYDLIEDIM
ncbi:MAG TPA: HAD family hydrolase [Bacilli bacterium]|nr:HAD family hydrolase [Bacilli bacterium]